MKRYMVRRTRSFIKDNYAHTDETGRKYLEFSDGRRSYFPQRLPRSLKFTLEGSSTDFYARLYSELVVEVINQLNLPRYGLGNYVIAKHKQPPTDIEQRFINNIDWVAISGLYRTKSPNLWQVSQICQKFAGCRKTFFLERCLLI